MQLVTPTIPPWLRLSSEQFEVWAVHKSLNSVSDDIRFSAVLSAFIHDKAANVLRLPSGASASGQ